MLTAEPLFAVADGMGGQAGGDVAAQVAIETLRSAFTTPSVDGLQQAIDDANRAVCERASGNAELRSMGTTLTAVALVDHDDEELFAVANIGDSRTYLLRAGELSQLTDDHSVVGELVRSGEITAAEASVHPRRNIITRVLGMPGVSADIQNLVPVAGDRVLLCSDGLYGEVSDAEIASVLRQEADPEAAARRLVELANEHGGNDNITVVIVDVVDDGDRAAAASAALAEMPAESRRSGLMSASERDAELRAIERSGPAPPRVETQEFTVPERRITPRVVAFVLVLVLLLAGTAAAVGWYARASYFVGLDDGRVAIFKGRPGGLLWFGPTLEQRTDITEASVPDARLVDLERGKEEPSLEAARAYIANLREEAAALTGDDAGIEPPSATTVPPTTTPTSSP